MMFILCIETFTGLVVRCEPPTVSLTQFNGSLMLENAEKWVALTNKQLLIRVCCILTLVSYL